jgi:hypothetical protein
VPGNVLLTSLWSDHVLGGPDQVDIAALAEVSDDTAAAVRAGDLGAVEGMLSAQIMTLNAVFLELLKRAATTSSPEAFEMYLRLGFRAQSQCRASGETLAQIKMPPVFAKQANIVHGPQCVDNRSQVAVVTGATPARAIPENALNKVKLLEANQDGERMDAGTSGAATGGDPVVEAVAVIDRSEDRRRKGAGRKERLQGRRASTGAGSGARTR